MKGGTAAGTMPLLRVIAMALLPLALIIVLVFAPARAQQGLPGYGPLSPPVIPPPLVFADAKGARVSLDDFSGKVVLLNLWATWCGPCIEEIPALDRLAAQLGGRDFQVVAVSVDRGAARVVEPFLARMGIGHLASYFDPDSRTLTQLQVSGLPTSLLIDRAGRIIGRVVGDPGWDTGEAHRLILNAIGERAAPNRGSLLIRTGG